MQLKQKMRERPQAARCPSRTACPSRGCRQFVPPPPDLSPLSHLSGAPQRAGTSALQPHAEQQILSLTQSESSALCFPEREERKQRGQPPANSPGAERSPARGGKEALEQPLQHPAAAGAAEGGEEPASGPS